MPALVLMLALASSGAGIKDPLAPYRGLPVLDVEAPMEEDVRELRELVGIERGYLLDGPSVQLALKRLYALGRFADVGAYATRVKGTVTLRFVLRPTQRLSALDIDGVELVDAD